MNTFNERLNFTRRYPNLRNKQLLKDSKISLKLISAWDLKQDEQLLFDTYIKENNNLSDERYWELLRSVYIVCGNLERLDIFKKLFNSKRKQKHYFSTPEEAKLLREMKNDFIVYRACNNNDIGISWTLSLEYAENYMKTFNKTKLLQKTINKKDVFAYINRNNEYEIIILN